MNPSIDRSGLAVVLVTATIAFAACGGDPAAGSDFTANTATLGQQDLSGTWVLNLEDSDLPERDRFRDRDRLRERPGPGRLQRRERDGDPPAPGMRGRGGPFFPEFTISQDESSLTFTGPDGRAVTFTTDGRTEVRELPRGGTMEITASWEGDLLVVERSVEERLTTTRSFALSEDGSQLFVTVRIEGERLPEPIDHVLVYDRA